MPEALILTWLVELASAVHYCHSRKVLHRDLKTANIFLSADSTLRLGDFGIARVLKYTLEQAKTVLGTPYYLSPELAQGRPYNGKSDVWAIGCILYELAMQRHPFDGSSIQSLVRRIIRGRFSPISSGYSPNLRGLVNLMLSQSPSARPAVGAILQLPFLQPYVHSYIKRCKQRGVPLPAKALPDEIAAHYAAMERPVPRAMARPGSAATRHAAVPYSGAGARPARHRPITAGGRVIAIGEPEPGSARDKGAAQGGAAPSSRDHGKVDVARPQAQPQAQPQPQAKPRREDHRAHGRPRSGSDRSTRVAVAGAAAAEPRASPDRGAKQRPQTAGRREKAPSRQQRVVVPRSKVRNDMPARADGDRAAAAPAPKSSKADQATPPRSKDPTTNGDARHDRPRRSPARGGYAAQDGYARKAQRKGAAAAGTAFPTAADARQTGAPDKVQPIAARRPRDLPPLREDRVRRTAMRRGSRAEREQATAQPVVGSDAAQHGAKKKQERGAPAAAVPAGGFLFKDLQADVAAKIREGKHQDEGLEQDDAASHRAADGSSEARHAARARYDPPAHQQPSRPINPYEEVAAAAERAAVQVSSQSKPVVSPPQGHPSALGKSSANLLRGVAAVSPDSSPSRRPASLDPSPEKNRRGRSGSDASGRGHARQPSVAFRGDADLERSAGEAKASGDMEAEAKQAGLADQEGTTAAANAAAGDDVSDRGTHLTGADRIPRSGHAGHGNQQPSRGRILGGRAMTEQDVGPTPSPPRG